MPMIIAPGTLCSSSAAVKNTPASASSGPGETSLPMSSRLLSAVTMPALIRPDRVISSPTPADSANFSGMGMASSSFSRSGRTVSARNSRPEIKTIARACCQV